MILLVDWSANGDSIVLLFGLIAGLVKIDFFQKRRYEKYERFI